MSFYKQVGLSVVCDMKPGQEVRYFIPESWFNSNIALVKGEFINILGIFSYALYDENDKPIGKLRNFNFPTAFLCQPSTIDKVKDLKLTGSTAVDDYRILRFKPGDKLIVETKVPRLIENVEAMFKLFIINGHIPNTIPYDQIHQYFLDNVKYSGNKFSGVPNQMIGMFVSKICRDVNDASKPFRLSKEKKEHKYNDYKSISVKEVPKYTSAYASFTSEVFDDSIIAATQVKNNDPSPLEMVLMGRSNPSATDAK